MSIHLFHVNAFSSHAFSGNPAAVCILEQEKTVQWMQAVAAQMNLSETAFVTKQHQNYLLRWFTPQKEVDMCGHATLASAHALWENGYADKDEAISFSTLGGILTATNVDGEITLDFPINIPVAIDPPHRLIDMLGIKPIYCAKFGEKHLFELENEEQLLALEPDFSALLSLPERGVTLTCRSSDPAYDFISRYFAPWVGINEDPVNGSSHCALAPFWSKKLDKTHLKAYQASTRGGELTLIVKESRVHLIGVANTVLNAQLLV